MSDRLLNERRLAKLAYKDRDFRQAAKLNRSLLKNYCEDMPAKDAAAVNLELGVCLVRLGEMEEAVNAFLEALRLDPTNERAKILHSEWSGNFQIADDEQVDAPAADTALDFIYAPRGASVAQIVDPLGADAAMASDPAMAPSFSGVVGVPHAERRPPFAWGLLTPILCAVGLCLLVIVLRSL